MIALVVILGVLVYVAIVQIIINFVESATRGRDKD